MSANSTLVETVSINYEDFNESFLTCSTCLCIYDAQDHIPKLLSCSHTVCRSCLERIVEGIGIRDAGSFRCPICRETIPMPHGGVAALPPSFLVNQLLDLMSRQPREVIPKCSTHPTQELMFCETCDCVFCTLCTNGTHLNGNGGSCEHTIIPFSTAIKRTSEILLYKAELCISKLRLAAENVNTEISKLERSSVDVLRIIDESFLELIHLVEKRKSKIQEEAQRICQEKKEILREQLKIIETEKEKVERQCTGLQYQVDLRNITSKICDLNEKMSSFTNIVDPRENSFLKFQIDREITLKALKEDLSAYGELKTSKTLPSLSFVQIGECSTHLSSSAVLQTVDYHGSWQSLGGDPVTSKLRHESGELVTSEVVDNSDGTYNINFCSPYSGNHKLDICVFERPVKGSAFSFTISEHINPIIKFGSRGTGEQNLTQPVGVVNCRLGMENFILVTDTGNSRVVVLNSDLEPVKYIDCKGLEDRAATGLAITSSDTLLVINWRYKTVTEINYNGRFVGQFTHSLFSEPIDIAINSMGQVLVADNGARCIFVLDMAGKLLKVIRQPCLEDGQITSITCGPCNEIIVAGKLLRVFNSSAELIYELGLAETKGKGLFSGVCCDSEGNLLATHAGKSKGRLYVYSMQSRKLNFVIDSDSDSLKRPCGVTISQDKHAFVVDLGNDCIKKYRYH